MMFKKTMKRWIACPTAVAVGFVLLSGGSVVANGVMYQVHAGGPDACGQSPGCDANYSLTAIMFADGSVSGQLTDRFAGGDGYNAEIDCLAVAEVEPGVTAAWVSGTIKSGTLGGVDLAGFPVWTAVADVGTSANDPFPRDLITFSNIGDPTSCLTQPEILSVFPTFQGQVTIR